MSVQDIEAAVSSLTPDELRAFKDWFEEYLDEAWDREIEQHAAEGKLDGFLKEAEIAYKEGRCKPL